METSPNTPNGLSNPDQLTFWSAEPPASLSQSEASEEEWMTSVVNSPLPMQDWLDAFDRAGSSGKTSRAFYPAAGDSISPPSKGRWLTSGIVVPGGSSTATASDFPSVVRESSLSDILETGDHLLRYCLSAECCKGILERSTRRGKMLPKPLLIALTNAANGG